MHVRFLINEYRICGIFMRISLLNHFIFRFFMFSFKEKEISKYVKGYNFWK